MLPNKHEVHLTAVASPNTTLYLFRNGVYFQLKNKPYYPLRPYIKTKTTMNVYNDKIYEGIKIFIC